MNIVASKSYWGETSLGILAVKLATLTHSVNIPWDLQQAYIFKKLVYVIYITVRMLSFSQSSANITKFL